MKRVIQLLMSLVFLLVPVVAMSAQDDDVCSADAIASRVGDAYAAYSETNAGNDDIGASLDGIDSLYNEINAIYAECDEARYQAYIAEGTTLIEALREGGYVIYVRHARTDSSQEDTDLSSCETQRNLNERGRADAASIGQAWSALNIPVGRLISTEYCRTHETAALAFGEPDIIAYAELEGLLDGMLAEIPPGGTNTVIVGHVDLLEAATGISVPEDTPFNEGDALVYRPMGGPMGDQGYQLAARISLRNWADLARIAVETMQ
jgi:phosphohistidine phosphatase SixA